MGKPAAVIGIGQTKYKRQRDLTLDGLVREAALRALEDAELTFAAIGAFSPPAYCSGPMPHCLNAASPPNIAAIWPNGSAISRWKIAARVSSSGAASIRRYADSISRILIFIVSSPVSVYRSSIRPDET